MGRKAPFKKMIKANRAVNKKIASEQAPFLASRMNFKQGVVSGSLSQPFVPDYTIGRQQDFKLNKSGIGAVGEPTIKNQASILEERVQGYRSEIEAGKQRVKNRQVLKGIAKGSVLVGTGAAAIGAGIYGVKATAQAIYDDSNRLYH